MSRLRLPALALLTSLFAGAPAWATPCVQASDTEAGLRLGYEGGGVTEVRVRPDGLVELTEVGTGAGGGDLVFTSRFGIYDLLAAAGGADAGADRRITYDYDGGPLVEPAPGATGWVGTVIATFPDAIEVRETAAFVFGRPGEIALGDCRYATLPVEATFLRETGWEGQSFLYFPDLGFATLVGKAGQDAPRAAFALTGIEPLPVSD